MQFAVPADLKVNRLCLSLFVYLLDTECTFGRPAKEFPNKPTIADLHLKVKET